MDKLQKLLARQDALLGQMTVLADKETLTEEEVASYDVMDAECEKNEAEIKRLEVLAQRKAKATEPVNEPVVTVTNEPAPKPYKNLVAQLRDVKAAAQAWFPKIC